MAVARPVLFFGPSPSHIADLLTKHRFGLQVAHGDIRGARNAIQQLRAMDAGTRATMGRTAQSVLSSSLSQEILCGRLCDGLELVFLKQR
jgi:hypothetical protein